jgi:putative ABC transport system ATP-binding protein
MTNGGGVAVRLEHVTKRHPSRDGTTAALDDVTLSIRPGEFVAVVGPSGSGKSTLLNLVAGLDRPTSGSVVVDGDELGRLTEDARSDVRLRRIGFVFQSFNLFPDFTARENVAWPLTFLGVRWRPALDRAATLLADLGLPPEAVRRVPADLSGGEQQRVALARALVTAPDLVLADEPTGNLDWRAAEDVLAILSRMNAKRATTVILVTHNVAAALYADRTVRLRHGRLVDDRLTPARLRERA